MNPQLEEIVTLARQMIAHQSLVEDMENALKDEKAALWKLQTEDLPSAMAEAQLTQFTLDTGEKIVIKPDFTVGIPVARKEEAFDWLEDHGFGGLIKTKVAVAFGKGELAKAEKLLNELAKKKLDVELSRDVHHQTLKAFVVEQTRDAKAVPLELFGAVPVNKANITMPKS